MYQGLCWAHACHLSYCSEQPRRIIVISILQVKKNKLPSFLKIDIPARGNYLWSVVCSILLYTPHLYPCTWSLAPPWGNPCVTQTPGWGRSPLLDCSARFSLCHSTDTLVLSLSLPQSQTMSSLRVGTSLRPIFLAPSLEGISNYWIKSANRLNDVPKRSHTL